MENIGSYLKREREFRKIELSEIAESTRISAGTLQALEEERFDELPGKAFVRGYLKSYAKHVGLDVADVLLRYENLVADSITQSKTAAKSSFRWNRVQKAQLLWIAAVIVLIGGVSLYFILK